MFVVLVTVLHFAILKIIIYIYIYNSILFGVNRIKGEKSTFLSVVCNMDEKVDRKLSSYAVIYYTG